MSQIRGSGPINKYEILMMMGILMLMLMLRGNEGMVRGTNLGEVRGIRRPKNLAIGDKKI